MRSNILIALVALLVALAPACLFAGQTNDPSADLKGLMEKIKTDIHAGKTTEWQLSDDLQQFDVLLAKYKGQKSDAVAEILFMKATVYAEVFDENAKADALMKQLKSEFQGTHLVAAIEQQDAMLAAAKKMQATLVPGTNFPPFNVQDLDGKPLSLADHKGRVVLVDFWATWCPLCKAELPNVTATYKKYHDQGFDIVGVSLDQDRDKMLSFIKANGMTWPQYFDGQGWKNKLALQYGIEALPAAYLIDRKGVIIGSNLHGADLGQAVARALAQK